MRSYFKSNVFTFVFFFCLALPSFASIIVEGSFKAILTDYYHYEGDHSDFGNPAIGIEILGSFSYDVTSSRTEPYEDPDTASYSGGPNWININFNIGGVDFSVAPDAHTSTSSGLIVQKTTPNPPLNLLDMFWISESYRKGLSISDPSYVHRSADLLLWGGVDDTDVVQDFTFSNGDVEAYLGLSSSGYFNGSYYREYLSGNILEFSITPKEVTVPEPSGLLLSSLVFLFIGWRTFQSSKFK